MSESNNDLDFAATQRTIYQALVETTRTASLVSAHDTEFYRVRDVSLGKSLDRQSFRLLQLTQRILRRCHSSDRGAPTLQDYESIDTSWKKLVDVTDDLLEGTDTYLDEFNGDIKRGSSKDEAPSWNQNLKSGKRLNRAQLQRLSKPQEAFEFRNSNHETEPFKPILTTKPHALTPLEESRILVANEGEKSQYMHPYKTEIESYTYPRFVYSTAEPQPYKRFESSTAEFVDTLEGVCEMLSELKKSTIIAVDLEHHDAHSYIGIVSLMQISTRDRDWLIDTLKPWRRKLEVLNEVFADPNILKVFHGAHMDIMWLQRDLGLYVVGLFDTHHASRVLGYSGGSLAFLLKKFVNFDAQKQYQTSDWRLRPLPPEMFDYARADTHFLLYIYDQIRNELLARSEADTNGKSAINEVLQRSKDTALQRYEHFLYDKDQGLGRGGWFSLLQRTPVLLSKEQFAVFRKVHQWRDQVARQEDENPTQIMPNHVIFKISQALPRELPALLNALHPMSHPTRTRVNDLLASISTTIAEAEHQPDMQEMLTRISKDIGVERGLSLSEVRSAGTNFAITAGGSDRPRLPTADIRADRSEFWGRCPFSYPQTAVNVSLSYKAIPQGSILDDHAKSRILLLEQEQMTQQSSVFGKRKAETPPVAGSATLAETTPISATSTLAYTNHELDRIYEKERRRTDSKGIQSASTASTETLKTFKGLNDPFITTQPHFDYEAASSVLNHGKREGADRTRSSHARSPRESSWNARNSLAAPDGKGSGVGRSFTYR